MISDQHKFIFVHTPKCAGSSVKRVLRTACSGEFRHNNWHFTIQELRNLLAKEPKDHSRYFKFSFTRNPYARLVSAFNYSANNIKNPGNYHWNHYRDSYTVLQKYTSISDDPVVNFRHFVASQDFSRIFDPSFPVHFVPQYRFFTIDGCIAVDYLGNTENFDESIGLIFQRLGMDHPDIPHENKSNYIPYQAFYDQATRRMVYETYEQDFKLLGYGKEIA